MKKIVPLKKPTDYGIGIEGRYRVMANPNVASFFIDQGWEPPYTRESRETEIKKRMMREGFTREEAEWDIDEEIQRDLEQWVALAFARTPSSLIS